MSVGCILGVITVTTENYSIHWTEDPGGGLQVALTDTMTVRDYFPDNSVAVRSLIQELKSAMDAKSLAAGNNWTYTITVSGTNGSITIVASGGDFELDITADSETLWTDAGFGTTDVISAANTLTAGDAPIGTWYPRTTDDAAELMRDSKWIPARVGPSNRGITGKRVTRKYGEYNTRDLKYAPLVGINAFAYPKQDIERVRMCYRDHWSMGKRVRVYTDSRTITDAIETDPDDWDLIFDAVIIDEELQIDRYEGRQEIDWWELALNFERYVS